MKNDPIFEEADDHSKDQASHTEVESESKGMSVFKPYISIKSLKLVFVSLSTQFILILYKIPMKANWKGY